MNQRHWITIGIVSYFTAGLYLLWYLFARYKRTRNNMAERRRTLDAFSLTASLGASLTLENLLNSNKTISSSKEGSLQEEDIRSSANSDTAKTTDTGLLSAIRDELDTADSLRKNAAEAQDNGEYDRALERYREAQQAYDDALETANECDFGDIIDLTAVEQKRDETKTARQETVHQQLENKMGALRSKLDQIEIFIDDGELKKARDRTQSLESQLRSIKQPAEQHSFDDICNAITDLKNAKEST